MGETINKELAVYEERLRMHRRALHQIPEVGYTEIKTQAYLLEQLKGLAPDDLRVFAETGVRAVFYGNGTGRTVAFRSDIDALPVKEETGCAFASQHEGFMHACGHDGHMANLLTFAEYIAARRDQLADTVVLLFQPAEETIGGAKQMIDEGALENPHVDVVYGMHLMPDIPKGRIACCAGPIMAQTCEMDFVIHGLSAHGATPHLGKDAVSAMAHLLTLFQTTVARCVDPCLLTLFQTTVARCVDPCQQALITIGKVTAGTQRNILASTAKMEGIVRTFSNQVYDQLERCIRNDIRGVEAAFGVEIDFIKRVFYPCVENDAKEFELVKAAAGERFMQAHPRMTAEDFSYYQLSVPGVFMFCGCKDDVHSSPLHASTFDFDEAALLTGFEVFGKLVQFTQ